MSRRTARIGEAIRETVSTTVLFELNDPRVKNVTVTGAEVTGDLRQAKVFVSVMGDDKQRSLAMHGLQSARGFLQRKVAQRLDIRYVPILEIVEDDSVKKSLEIARILREVLPEGEGAAEGAADGGAADGGAPPTGDDEDAEEDFDDTPGEEE